ncbi:MAG: hypothetical protein GY915_02350 [bacterium]|nr:hypothetical protein [bacterium]
MKISQTVDFGQVSHSYVSSWKSDNEVELFEGENKVVFTMSEEVMSQLHKKLGEKLTQISDERIAEAKSLSEGATEGE